MLLSILFNLLASFGALNEGLIFLSVITLTPIKDSKLITFSRLEGEPMYTRFSELNPSNVIWLRSFGNLNVKSFERILLFLDHSFICSVLAGDVRQSKSTNRWYIFDIRSLFCSTFSSSFEIPVSIVR